MLSINSNSYVKGGFLKSPSEETLINHSFIEDSGQACGQLKNDCLVTSKIVPSSLLSLEKAIKISVSCIYCTSQEKEQQERSWQGIIIGRHVAGSILALLVRIKLRHINGPLFGFLTICKRCCTAKNLHDREVQMDRIVNFKSDHESSRKTILRVTNEEMEELFSAKVISFMGRSTMPFRTPGSAGEWKEWNSIG